MDIIRVVRGAAVAGAMAWAARASGSAGTEPEVAPPPRAVERAEAASTLKTSGKHIRQFAFDGDPKTYFASQQNPSANDSFTLILDHPVDFHSARILTGAPDGKGALQAGTLELSADGKKFHPVAPFKNGLASFQGNRRAKALRIRLNQDLTQPLLIREIEIESKPRVARFRHPIEFSLDASDAPGMKEWGEKAIRVCERQYSMICEELASDSFHPPTQLHMSLRKDYQGVAAAGGGRIVGSVRYFKSHPDDIGAMVHETVHCVQSYRARGLPGWLVEGIADYVRFWKYEPGKAGRIPLGRARYNGSYRITAAFLAFLAENYDRQIVKKLNAQLRKGQYDPGIWKQLTGKSIEELNQQWRQSLAR